MGKTVMVSVAIIWCAAALLFALSGMTGEGAQRTVTVDAKNVNYGSEYLTVDICRPVVSGFDDDAFQRVLNSRIARQIASARDEAETYATTDGIEIGYHCVFYAEYRATCKKGIFSMKVTTLLENGGTGMPMSVYYNADIAQSRMISLADLFWEGAPYKARIGTVLSGELAKDPVRYDAGFAGMTDDISFYVSDGQLYIAFAKYEIADGMTGEPAFAIPTDAIAYMLKTEYAGLLK